MEGIVSVDERSRVNPSRRLARSLAADHACSGHVYAVTAMRCDRYAPDLVRATEIVGIAVTPSRAAARSRLRG